MEALVQRLMSLQSGPTESNQPLAIFGMANQMARHLDTRERVRIGLWPVMCTASPELGMCVAMALAGLLDRWRDIRVYHIFAQLEGEAEAYTWSIEKSQFGVDDWGLDSLDENVAIWGTLTHVDTQWKLKVEVENDMVDEEYVEVFAVEAASMETLITQLPKTAVQIAEYLDVSGVTIHNYESTQLDDDMLKTLSARVLRWYVDLLVTLWGKDITKATIIEKIDGLLKFAASLDDPFGVWLVVNAINHATLPGYGLVATTIADYAPQVVARLPNSPHAANLMSLGLFRNGEIQLAYDIMEAEVTTRPDNPNSWRTLSYQYQAGGRYNEAVHALQRAIEAKATTEGVYLTYAALLIALANDNWDINEFALIDPDNYEADFMHWEAIAAYELALGLNPERVSSCERLLVLLLELLAEDDKRFWTQFEQLVELDKDGAALRSVVDLFYNVEDPEPAIEIMEKQIEQNPHRVDLLINLAVIHLNISEENLAIEYLEKAEELTNDELALADIDHLILIADDPTFETRMAEISGLVNAGQSIRVDDADFLESVIERAPSISEAYVLLGKTYLIWGEADDALHTLLDGHDALPDDPDIIEALATTLWESDQRGVAFDYLNKGIAANPNHVPLLALTGLYLFENEQTEQARSYLARAESIAPRHPALAAVRAAIARNFSG